MECDHSLALRAGMGCAFVITRLRFVLVLQSSALPRGGVIAGCSFVRALPMVAFRSAKGRGPWQRTFAERKATIPARSASEWFHAANQASDSTRQIKRVVPPRQIKRSVPPGKSGEGFHPANRAIGYSGSMPKSRIVSSVSSFNPRSANLASPPARRSMIPRTPSTFKPKASAASTACNALPPLVITSSTI